MVRMSKHSVAHSCSSLVTYKNRQYL